jgi:transmembrane sensor
MDDLKLKFLEDLVFDSSFIEFVRNDNDPSVKQWKNYTREHPQNKKEFETAVLVIRMLLKANKNETVNTEIMLEQLLAQIAKDKKRSLTLSVFQGRWRQIAAIFILAFTISAVWYFVNRKTVSENNSLAYNEIIVPMGEKAQLILSDGTHIWLNSSSRLCYPVNFGDHNRTVFLEGEAFFDVTKKAKQTFTVNTKTVKVNVLGTAFNVKSYPGDKKVETTVVRGLVCVENITGKKMKPVFLKPNEKYELTMETASEKELNKNDKQADVQNHEQEFTPVILRKINVAPVTSWKDQLLVFSDETLEDVTVKMERWYNVKIHIMNNDLKHERYRGQFIHNENILQVLEAIKFTTPIQYTIDKDEIYIERARNNIVQ